MAYITCKSERAPLQSVNTEASTNRKKKSILKRARGLCLCVCVVCRVECILCDLDIEIPSDETHASAFVNFVMVIANDYVSK